MLYFTNFMSHSYDTKQSSDRLHFKHTPFIKVFHHNVLISSHDFFNIALLTKDQSWLI